MTTSTVRPSSGWRRVLLAGLPPLLGVLPATVLLLTAGDRLPARLASHFGASGIADGFSSRGATTAVTAGTGIAMALLFGLFGRQLAHSGSVVSRWDTGRLVTGAGWGVGAFLGTTLCTTVAINLDRIDAAGVRLPAWTIPAALAAALAAGAIGVLLAPRTPTTQPEPARAPIALAPSERISWSRFVGPRHLQLVGAALVAAGAGLWVVVGPALGATIGGTGVVAALWTSATVTVDRRGLTIGLGVLGWPRLRIPLSDVAEATAATISAAQFGGWGYRLVPGGTGVILRSGPALIVTRTSGRRFTVTVDDPDTAAAVLTGLAGQPARSC